jgi:hypothetical protein
LISPPKSSIDYVIIHQAIGDGQEAIGGKNGKGGTRRKRRLDITVTNACLGFFPHPVLSCAETQTEVEEARGHGVKNESLRGEDA